MGFTKKEKEKILLANGYEKVQGYCFPVGHSEDYDNIIIPIEDAKPVIDEGVQTFYYNVESGEYEDIEEAFELFYDGFYCDGNYENEEIAERAFRKKYLSGE